MDGDSVVRWLLVAEAVACLWLATVAWRESRRGEARWPGVIAALFFSGAAAAILYGASG